MLIFRGGASKRFPAAAETPFAETYPTKPTVVLCPTSGHFPTASETDIVADGLLRFLAACR